MKITNGNVFLDNRGFEQKDLTFAGDRITFADTDDKDVFDAEGMYVLPGFVEMHMHGCCGADASNGELEDFATMSDFLGKNGVTSFCPTTMTLPIPTLEKAFCAANEYRKKQTSGSRLIGCNMEGPFFSMAKKGAQNPAYIKDPSIEAFDRLWDASEGCIAVADLAPELPGAMEYIEHVSKKTTVSIAHTMSDYDTAVKAIESGVTSCTHLFNAMPPYTHRAPGVVGAVFESDTMFAELICDCIHIHPAVIKAVFKVMGDDRVCVISDALPCTGLEEGQKYQLGGLDIYLKGNCARLEDGTLAGSACTQFMDFQKIVRAGVPLESAVKACTANPARNLGIYDRLGSLTEGKLADVIVLDKDLELKAVFIGGKRVR